MEGDPTLEALLSVVSAQRGPAAAIEVEVGGSHYDKETARWHSRLVLSVVVAAPSLDDSRFSPVLLHVFDRVEEPVARRVSDLGSALATVLGVPFYLPETNPNGRAPPRWIQTQGPPPMRGFSIEWTACTWDDDGHGVVHDGRKTVAASSGYDARRRLVQTLEQQFGPRSDRRFSVLDTAEFPLECSIEPELPPLPVQLPTVHALRTKRLDGATPSTLLRLLFAATPTPTVLTVMFAWSAAFARTLQALDPIPAWREERIDDATADQRLEQGTSVEEYRWRAPHRMAEGHAAGERPWDFLRDTMDGGVMSHAQAIRNAFGMRLRDIKELHQHLCFAPDAARLDEAFERGLKAVSKPDSV